MQVSQIMTPEPQTASPTDTIRKVATMMDEGDFGSIPILDGDLFVGMVTDRDIALRGVAEGLGPDTEVGDVMSEEPIYVEPDCDIDEAVDIMMQEQIRRLYVVEGGRLLGVVSLADLALEDEDDEISGEALEQISEPD